MEWGGWICVGVLGWIVASYMYWFAKRWEHEAVEILETAKAWHERARRAEYELEHGRPVANGPVKVPDNLAQLKALLGEEE